MGVVDRLAGKRVLEEAVSPINGRVSVVREFLWGTYIMAGGLPQSGGLAERIWRKPLKKVSRTKPQVSNILILGLGGGGMVSIIAEHWPEAIITGVDIDPIMVEFGEKYLEWDENDVNVVIADAEDFVSSAISRDTNPKKQNAGYDLVCVDMYVGQSVPGKFNTESFIRRVKKLLNPDGIAIFNRLYGGGNKDLANEFGRKLEKVFTDIQTVRPEANKMFLCRG